MYADEAGKLGLREAQLDAAEVDLLCLSGPPCSASELWSSGRHEERHHLSEVPWRSACPRRESLPLVLPRGTAHIDAIALMLRATS